MLARSIHVHSPSVHPLTSLIHCARPFSEDLPAEVTYTHHTCVCTYIWHGVYIYKRGIGMQIGNYY